MSDIGVEPTGYQVLLSIKPVEEKTKGGVYMPDQSKSYEETAATVCKVEKLGPDAYSDVDRFPSGPYCKVGDWVLIGKFAGKRYKFGGREFRLINDDLISGLVTGDPNEVKRV